MKYGQVACDLYFYKLFNSIIDPLFKVNCFFLIARIKQFFLSLYHKYKKVKFLVRNSSSFAQQILLYFIFD